MVLGRLAGYVAKDALLGEEVQVINCEKVIISGKRVGIIAHERERRDRKGYPLTSAKLPRLSDRFVRRTIRGMLPWKQSRGRVAFARVMCHIGVPAEFVGKATVPLQLKKTKARLPYLYYVTVEDVCKGLGGTR